MGFKEPASRHPGLGIHMAQRWERRGDLQPRGRSGQCGHTCAVYTPPAREREELVLGMYEQHESIHIVPEQPDN